MSLSLIYGSSGSGKSMGLYNRIIKESMENKDKNFLIIVPEQYTMSTQRQMVSMHPNKCIMNIDVLSFNRLAYRVFEEIGAAVHTVLDDTGKSLVIRKLVENHIDELRVLKNNITRISYITQVKSLISEMNQYNITPEKLQEMVSAPTMSESFRRKATDLAVLYEAFLDFIKGKYVTTESILSTLDSMLDSSQIVDGATVVLDGFTGFTPIQYQLVEHLLKICDEVAVTITADEDTAIFEKQPDSELFSMSCEFAVRMAGLAKKAGVEISEPTFISNENGWLSSNPVLSHLEKNIFRNKQSIYKGDDANDSIILTSLKNSREELKYVAITINRLVRQGMRYKDIAVVPTVGSEGTSLSLLEAMASGCAVVCTNVGGMTNIVLDGYNGLMIYPEEEELYNALTCLIEDSSLRAKLQANAYNCVKDAFSLHRWKDAWKKVIDNVTETM